MSDTNPGRSETKKRLVIRTGCVGPRAIFFLALAVAFRLFEIYYQAPVAARLHTPPLHNTTTRLPIRNASAQIPIHNATTPSPIHNVTPPRASWRRAFPKRPDLFSDSNSTEQVFCIFLCISSPFERHTARFSDDLWNWTDQVTMWSLARQTYNEFDVLADYPSAYNSSFGMFELHRMKCTTSNVNALLRTDERNCSWVVTTRVDPGAYLKSGFVSDMVQRLQQAGRQVPHIQSILLFNKAVSQIIVDGVRAQRCKVTTFAYSQGGGPVGQTLAVKYNSWQQIGGLSVGDVPFEGLFEEAMGMYASTGPVMPVKLPEDHAFEIITRLSGPVFPWIKGLPICNGRQRDWKIGIPLFALKTVPLTPFLDVCEAFGNFQQSYETRALFNHSDQGCHQAKGFGWETNQSQLVLINLKPQKRVIDAKLSKPQKGKVDEKSQFCTFVQVEGPRENSDKVYANEFWKWTEAMTFNASLAHQSITDFVVIVDPPHPFAAGRLQVVQAPLTAAGVGSILRRDGKNWSCEWVVTVHLFGGDFIEPDHISKLHQHVTAAAEAHPQIHALIEGYAKVKQVVVDIPEEQPRGRKKKQFACQSKTVAYDGAGSPSALAIAVRSFYWKQSKGVTAAECLKGPVGCVHRTGIAKPKIAHGTLKGQGFELTTRLSAKFPWGLPLEHSECNAERLDTALGHPVLSMAANAIGDMPRLTTFWQACTSNPEVLMLGTEARLFKPGEDCKQAELAIQRREPEEKKPTGKNPNEG